MGTVGAVGTKGAGAGADVDTDVAPNAGAPNEAPVGAPKGAPKEPPKGAPKGDGAARLAAVRLAGAGAALVSLLSLVAVRASRTATRLPVLDTDKGGMVSRRMRECKEIGVQERVGQGTT
jgi:hypothetical protein